ncbi:4071_t:CDS:1, partial [Funneliformis mosseae]
LPENMWFKHKPDFIANESEPERYHWSGTDFGTTKFKVLDNKG